MAAIEIRREHSLGTDVAKERAEQLAGDLKSKMGIDWSWDGDRIRFEAGGGAAKGVKGTVSVSDTDVRVAIDLPFLLKAMKGTIASKVNDKLDKLLA